MAVYGLPVALFLLLQIQLNVFQFFMFWTAFYVLRGARSTDKG
jgi:hypothetical protein